MPVTMCSLPVLLSSKSQMSALGAELGVMLVHAAPPLAFVERNSPLPLVARYMFPALSHKIRVPCVKALVLLRKLQVMPWFVLLNTPTPLTASAL